VYDLEERLLDPHLCDQHSYLPITADFSEGQAFRSATRPGLNIGVVFAQTRGVDPMFQVESSAFSVQRSSLHHDVSHFDQMGRVC
jgi:hypothetical protein